MRRAECPAKQPRARQGFTLAELLVAMVIAALASAVVIRSLTFSLQFFQARSEDTSVQLLCETVSLLVQDDLTRKAYSEVLPDDYACVNGRAPTISSVTLPAACYGFGNAANDSRAVEITVAETNPVTDSYQVTVSVTASGGAAASNTFTVTPLGTAGT